MGRRILLRLQCFWLQRHGFNLVERMEVMKRGAWFEIFALVGAGHLWFRSGCFPG